MLLYNAGFAFAYVQFAYYATVFSQGFVDQAPDGQSGTIKFGPPDLSDEMASSLFVPDSLKCDACKAIAYQVWSGFKEFNDKHKFYNNKLPESVVMDLVDEICAGDNVWNEYGIKQGMNGKQMLSGPGLDGKDEPGVMQAGGKWPGRLRDMCEVFVGELGEMAIYKTYNKTSAKHRSLEDFLCYGPINAVSGTCTKKHLKRKEL